MAVVGEGAYGIVLKVKDKQSNQTCFFFIVIFIFFLFFRCSKKV